MALRPAPWLGDSYWTTTAQLLAADATEGDEKLARVRMPGRVVDASSAVPPATEPSGETTTPAPKANAGVLAIAASEQSPVVAQARRMRDRLKVRRLYYRKLERLNDLRAQVSALETQLETLALSQQQQQQQQQQRVSHAPQAPDGGAPKLLHELASTRQQLQHENEFLRRRVAQFVRAAHSLSVKLVELRAPPTAFLRIKAVTRQECAEMRRRMFAEARKLARNRARFRSTGSACGWAATQLLLDGVYNFHLEKRVPRVRAACVAERTWALLCDPARFARLYSTAVEMRCYLLQTVDADSVVMFHEHRTMNPAEEREMVIRTVVLLARATTPEGYAITLTSLDRGKWVLEDLSLREVQEAVVWNEVFCWLQYSDDGDAAAAASCVCTFAGVAPTVGASVYFWMVEFVQIAVRWEAEVFGAASYLLKSSDTEQSAL
ncbi:hypothetical protein PybrP1_007508 [[Pythium] brassicae (nom. inval.)]|nr:hypothetical protein PybrP1_007508 [[Pythium] brassicae (nom. inval.)]